MQKVSYVEDKNLLAQSIEARNYKGISKYINSNKHEWNYYIQTNQDNIYGYNINRISQLSELYGHEIFAVRFFYDNVTNLFNEKEKGLVYNLLSHLIKEMDQIKGYYIIKIPTDNILLINQLNELDKKFIFAGGTVCYYAKHKKVESLKETSLDIKLISGNLKLEHRNKIMNLSERSFNNHSSQYHISSLTREQAPFVYRNWIEDYLDATDDKNLMVAFYNNIIVGFLAFEDYKDTQEIILNCVDEEYRGLGIYERMLRHCMKIASKNKKLVTISTQINNYPPQRAWVNCGFKPFYSFYLHHYNNL